MWVVDTTECASTEEGMWLHWEMKVSLVMNVFLLMNGCVLMDECDILKQNRELELKLCVIERTTSRNSFHKIVRG